MRRLVMVAVVVLGWMVTDVHAQALNEQGQHIMDAIISVLRQLMTVAVDFIRMVLTEIVHAIQALLPDFTSAK